VAESNGDWLRVRGLGRERFSTYLADYLTTLGYVVEKDDSPTATESRLAARLERTNPAVPSGAAHLSFRAYPTSGGAAVVWETPTEIKDEERGRMDRLVRELTSHLERAISTESHATAKVIRPSTSRLPWEKRVDPPNGTASEPAA
jgi:hypothetical protein